VAEIGLGLREPRLAAGNLSSRRALLDVRDMVRALILSAERCQAGDVFNVGGKTAYSVAEIIDWIRELSGENFEVFQEASLMRRSDEPVIHGDTSKFEHACGWRPEIPLRSTLQDMLDWWRQRLAADARPAVVTHD
jgi:nucleoside-diphosphate-sugar epimerase